MKKDYFKFLSYLPMPLTSLTYTDTSWKTISLADYRDYTILIVNTATWCGLTPQFVDLEALYQKYKDQKFVIIGFPCNQFAGQEPISDSKMTSICLTNYGVTFPLSAKIHVNGPDTHPIFKYLKDTVPNGLLGKTIKRNFTKFLIDRSGNPVQRYAPTTLPTDIESDIVALL